MEQLELPALPNNLATTLSIFPLAESRPYLCKDVVREELSFRDIAELLFPSLDDDMFNAFLRMGVVESDEKISNIGKKRKHEQTKALEHIKRVKRCILGYKTEKDKKDAKRVQSELVKIHKKTHKFIFDYVPKIVEKQYIYSSENEFGVRMVSPFKLYPYQAKSVEWLIERDDCKVTNEFFEPGKNGSVFAMFMGLGKTLTTGTLVARTLGKQRFERSCTLYVCPKGLLGTVYREFDKFFGDQVRCIIFHKDILRGNFRLFGRKEIQKYDVVITTYETISFRARKAGLFGSDDKTFKKEIDEKYNAIETENAKQFMNFNWFRIILDESHEIRERKTIRYKSISSLISTRRIAMTGTPICNSFSDVFSQMSFCGLQITRGMKMDKKTFKQLDLMKMMRFVHYNDAKAQITIPPKTVHVITYTLSPNEKMLHDHFLKSAQTIFKLSTTYRGQRRNTTAFEAKSSMLRILQICSAPYLITPGAKEKYKNDDVQSSEPVTVFEDEETNTWIHDKDGPSGIGSSKNLKFISLMTELGASGDKIVVFANYTSTVKLAIHAMCKHFREFKDQHVFVHGSLNAREREVRYTKFREGDGVKVLFMTLKVGSVGLNLTEACKLVFLEPWYSYAALQQGEARVHRIGQTKPVDIYYLLGSNTVEERVYRIAERKRQTSEDLKSDHDKIIASNTLESILFNENCMDIEVMS